MELHGFVRTTITIPKQLKEEMKKHPDINWSATAARAFQEAIEKANGKVPLEQRVAWLEQKVDELTRVIFN